MKIERHSVSCEFAEDNKKKWVRNENSIGRIGRTEQEAITNLINSRIFY